MPTTVVGRCDDSIVSPVSGEAVFCPRKAPASDEGVTLQLLLRGPGSAKADFRGLPVAATIAAEQCDADADL